MYISHYAFTSAGSLGRRGWDLGGSGPEVTAKVPSRSGGGPTHILVCTKLLVPGVRDRVPMYPGRTHMADRTGPMAEVSQYTEETTRRVQVPPSSTTRGRLHVAMFTHTGCVEACALWGGAHISGDAGPGGHVTRGSTRKRALIEISRKHASASQMARCPFGVACIRERTADRARARADHERAKVRARAQVALARHP